MNLFIEYLTLWSFFKIFFFRIFFYKNKKISFYYIEISQVVIPILTIYKFFTNIKVSQLQFKMRNIKDHGELVKLKLFRKDLFDFQKNIIKSDSYNIFFHKYSQDTNLKYFLNKSFIWNEINEPIAVSRVLYLINVINQNKSNFINDQNLIIINKRPWFDIYKNYANYMSISIEETNLFSPLYFFFVEIKNTIKIFYKYLFKKHSIGFNSPVQKKLFFNYKNTQPKKTKPLLYLIGRGDLNFKNDGNYSDFFCSINSDFSLDNILYSHHSKEEALLLKNNNINITDKRLFWPKSKIRKFIPSSKKTKKEINSINKHINHFNGIYNYWNAFFNTYNVKILLNWYLYNPEHIAIHEAIKNNNGISAIWQMAFDGTPYIECMNVSDIFFTFSRLTSEIYKKNGSKTNFNIITGYPKDYLFPLINSQPKKIRSKLESAGAKKIIAVFDENSLPDDRWHTGHALQRENYYHVLERMLKDRELGVIFKPKHANSIRKRLGPVNELLNRALETGRCYIFDQSGKYTTLSSPVYAAFNADLCIHSHLSGSTAAVECALNNLPVIVIDREGVPYDKLSELPKNKILFNTWEEAIEKSMIYLDNKSTIPDFANWSPYLELFDPYRDGKAAYRIGTLLSWIYDGYNQNKYNNEIMEQAIDRYIQKWGEDKIIVNN